MRGWFFADLDDRQVDLLQRNNLIFSALTIGEQEGCVVGADNLDAALNVLNARLTETHTTPYAGIIEAVIAEKGVPEEQAALPLPEPKKAEPEYKVGVCCWSGDGNQDDFVRAAQEILLPVVKKNIQLHVPRDMAPPGKSDQFHIHLSSCYENSSRRACPAKVFGIDMKYFFGLNVWTASGRGIAIGDNDFDVAELVGNDLYIHYYICQRRTENDILIFRRILEETAAWLALSPEELEAKKRAVKHTQSRRKYIALCVKRMEARISLLQSEIGTLTITLNQGHSNLVGSIRECAYNKLILDSLTAALEGSFLYAHADFLLKLEDVVSEISGKRAEKTIEDRKEIWLSNIRNFFRDRVGIYRRCCVESNKDVIKYQGIIADTAKNLSAAKVQLAAMEGRVVADDEQYGLEFDKLASLPKVRDIAVANDFINVFTETLFCKNPQTGKTYEIGQFRIQLPVDGNTTNLRWHNETRRVNAYSEKMHAPHVFPDGHACLGNASQAVAELTAAYEFAALAMLAIQFVETVNLNDAAGKHLDKWPVVEEPAKKQDGNP